jgi:thiamine biosynthesis protein ThiS
MEITLNNNTEHFNESVITVSRLLELKKFTFKMLIIKINGKIVKSTDYATAEIKNGDNVSVIHLISGG